MNSLENQKKLSKHIFRLLKVNEIVFPIGRTNKGNLGLKFTDNSEDFEIYLDAVPLSTKDVLNDENNIELKKMLEKYLFDTKLVTASTPIKFYPDDMKFDAKALKSLEAIVDDGTTVVNVGKVVDGAGKNVTEKFLGKKRGRPAGSKNKK